MNDRICVQVDTDVRALVPRFLANRRRDLELLREAVERGDFDTVRTLGHNLKGSARGYGFDALAELGSELQDAARSSDRAAVLQLRGKLNEFLDHVDVANASGAPTPPGTALAAPDSRRVEDGCVLLVEEQEMNRLLLQRDLASAGYRVECVANADEALARIGRYPPPMLILLDAGMDGIGGYEVCRKIKADPLSLELPVILVTSLDSREDRIRCIEAGADDFLSRPVYREELLARVRSLHRLSKARKALEHAQVVREIEKHEHLRRMFERYVPPKLVNMIMSRKEDVDALLSKRSRSDAVVLFTDLRGFTRMSEALPADTVVDLLNEFFAALTQVARAHEGTIFNMTGDGLLIGFNVPVPQHDAGGRALRSACDMLEKFHGMAQTWKAAHGVEVALGIGINRGDVVVGNVGSSNYMNFTVIGDTVNVAARLVQHAGRNEILMTGAVLEAIAKGLPESALEPLQPIKVKGKSVPLQVYRARPELLREFGKRRGPANPRVLIIDDSEDFRLLASRYVLVEWPGAEIEEWDPVARGKPAHDFAWGQYDVLLLDYQLGTEDGLAWLGEFRRHAKCPPVIFLTGAGNESIAARAIKEGAAEYLSKLELTKARLVEAIAAAISERADDARTVKLDLPAPRPAQVGGGPKPLSGYQIVRKIGQGGMAEVYLAIRARDGLPLVLKMLSPKLREDERHVTRFVRESGFISKMGGPYVATIYDQSVTPDCAYIAMEYFSGGDLQQRIGPSMSRGQAVRYLVELAWALDYVHGSDVIHRDLKPHNVMFREDGSIALVDFGISKAVADEAGLTKHGEMVGTPRYMSPECCRGEKVDHRHDLYSLGIIFYEMLSGGKLPYEGDTALELVYKHLRAPIPRLAPELMRCQPILDRLLAKRPEDRYQSACELIEDVKSRLPDILTGVDAATVPLLQSAAA